MSLCPRAPAVTMVMRHCARAAGRQGRLRRRHRSPSRRRRGGDRCEYAEEQRADKRSRRAGRSGCCCALDPEPDAQCLRICCYDNHTRTASHRFIGAGEGAAVPTQPGSGRGERGTRPGPGGIDDPQRPSGGNVYDRRVCDGSQALGWSVHEHAVAGQCSALMRRPAWPVGAALARVGRRSGVWSMACWRP